jgi:hypothetical protein
VALSNVSAFGSHRVDHSGLFMDYDGVEQRAPDITTRGMVARGCAGASPTRYYLDVYPALAGGPLGASVAGKVADCPAEGAPPGSRRCLTRRARFRRSRLGRIRLGERRSTLLRRLPPSSSSRRVLRYCVRGGGRVLVVLSRAGRVRLVVSTAKGHSSRGARRGTTLRRLRRAFPRLRKLRGTLYTAGGRRFRRVVFRVRRKRVRFVGLADVRLVRSRRTLRAYVRLAGL